MFACRFSRKCAAKMYIVCESTSSTCNLFKTNKSHTHNRKTVGISPTTKAKIDEMSASGITKPKLILRNIVDAGLKEPKARQVSCNNQYTKETGNIKSS